MSGLSHIVFSQQPKAIVGKLYKLRCRVYTRTYPENYLLLFKDDQGRLKEECLHQNDAVTVLSFEFQMKSDINRIGSEEHWFVKALLSDGTVRTLRWATEYQEGDGSTKVVPTMELA